MNKLKEETLHEIPGWKKVEEKNNPNASVNSTVKKV